MSKKNPHNMTDRQYAFCIMYLSEVPRNQVKAYKAAYENVKSDNAAHVGACRLMKNPKVSGYLDEQEERIRKKFEKGFVTSAEKALEEEGFLAHSSIKYLFNPDGTFVPPHELPDEVARMIKKVKPIGIKVGTDKDGEPIIKEGYEYEFWDKGQALNRIERVFGMQRDTVDLNDDEHILKSILERIDGKDRGVLPSERE